MIITRVYRCRSSIYDINKLTHKGGGTLGTLLLTLGWDGRHAH